jgi:hypothetical protein
MSRAQLTSTVEQNTGGAVAPFLAGKNKIINGDFAISQRGSSFSSNASYTLDRWYMIWDGSGATRAVSQQTFVPGTGYASGDSITASAPVGFYGANFLRYNQSVAGSGGTYSVFQQKIEDVHTFAGQTVTFSFWAKASSTVSLGTYLNQNFGTSGSSDTNTSIVYQTVTTAWQRFAITISVQSISGKTIGANSFLMVPFVMPLNSTFTIDICGVQLEAGSVATPFTTCSNTLQGELALCQRYYENNYPVGYAPGSDVHSVIDTGQTLFATVATGGTAGSNRAKSTAWPYKVTKRTPPTNRSWDLSGNLTKYTAGDANGSFGTANNSFDIYGSVETINTTNIAFQTVTASSSHIYAMVMWEASAEL